MSEREKPLHLSKEESLYAEGSPEAISLQRLKDKPIMIDGENGVELGELRQFQEGIEVMSPKINEGEKLFVSNDRITWSEVRPYSKSSNWKMSSGGGVKTVYARFRDRDGNWSEVVSSNGTGTSSPQPPGNLRIISNQ